MLIFILRFNFKITAFLRYTCQFKAISLIFNLTRFNPFGFRRITGTNTLKNLRLKYFFAFIIVIALGLLSRSSFIPKLIYPYLGDALYAVMIFYLVAFLFPQKGLKFYFLSSICICFAIEFSQLYQADWINHLRKHKLIALVLGSGFLWSDLMAYIVGASLAYFGHLFYKKS